MGGLLRGDTRGWEGNRKEEAGTNHHRALRASSLQDNVNQVVGWGA